MTEPSNQMHQLRRFAHNYQFAIDSVTLSPEEIVELCQNINRALGIIDSFWEIAAGRKLTDAEKGLTLAE